MGNDYSYILLLKSLILVPGYLVIGYKRLPPARCSHHRPAREPSPPGGSSALRPGCDRLARTAAADRLRGGRTGLELLPVEPIVQTLLRKPAETEVIITCRCKSRPAYFDLASLHSEMVCHKHDTERGVDLQRGVDD